MLRPRRDVTRLLGSGTKGSKLENLEEGVMELAGIAPAPCSRGSATPAWQPGVISIQSTDSISIQGLTYYLVFLNLGYPIQCNTGQSSLPS